MSTPINSQIILIRPRLPVLLGNIVAVNAPVQFGIPETNAGNGQLCISAYQSGLSAVTALLEASIDQGISWFSVPATASFYGTSTLTGDTAVTLAASFDVNGLAGSQMRFGFTAATGLTGCPIYAVMG